MSFKSAKTNIFLVSVSTVIIIFAIAITAQVQGPPEKAFSQVITFGPVWNTNTWRCTSDADFMIHGTIRALSGGELSIRISGEGAQSRYTFEPSDLYSFSVGASAGKNITLTRTQTVTGWITLQTTSDATASCKEV